MEEEIHKTFKDKVGGASIETKEVINQLLKMPDKDSRIKVMKPQVNEQSRPVSRSQQASRERKKRTMQLRKSTSKADEFLKKVIKRELSFKVSKLLTEKGNSQTQALAELMQMIKELIDDRVDLGTRYNGLGLNLF